MLSIDAFSDIFLDQNNIKLNFPRHADVLLFGGNLSLGFNIEIWDYFCELCDKNYEKKFVVLGNYDFYDFKNGNNPIFTIISKINKLFADKWPTWSLLYNNKISWFDYNFIGTTLLPPIPLLKVPEDSLIDLNLKNIYINDKELIDIDTWNKISHNEFIALKAMISTLYNQNNIVLTHYSPTTKIANKNDFIDKSDLYGISGNRLDIFLPNHFLYWYHGHLMNRRYNVPISNFADNTILFKSHKGKIISNTPEKINFDKTTPLIFNPINIE